KNRNGSDIPLRADLADELADWIAEKLEREQDAAMRAGQPIPCALPASTPIFDVPDGLVRILNRDLKAAGIPKRDERGQTVDVHALRHSFITLLSKGGVSPRTAQAAARHGDIKLTMKTYTDPKLLDVHGALDALPELSLNAPNEALKGTGTDAGKFAVKFAVGHCKPGQNASTGGNRSPRAREKRK